MSKGNPNPSPATRFKPGVKPEGAGRPKEARDRLSRAFLTAFADDFEKHGAKAIVKVRTEDPSTYVRVAASLQPKEIEVSDPVRDMNNEMLAALIEDMKEKLRAKADKANADQPQPPVQYDA